MLVAGAVYLVLLLAARLLSIVPDWFRPISLCAIPGAAFVYALAMIRPLSPKQTARLIDERTGSKELFLTAALIGEAPGEYQAIVLNQAEQRAAEVSAAKVLPFAWQRGVRDVACASVLIVAGLAYLPQLDPFGKQVERQQLAKEAERLRETKKITALRSDQLAESPKTDRVEKALAELDKTFKATKPDEREANLKRLG